MIRILMLTPTQQDPMWYRKAWQGVRIAADRAVIGARTVTVPTADAIAGLREKNPGAAYFWSCCLARTAGPTMSFPRGICEIMPV